MYYCSLSEMGFCGERSLERPELGFESCACEIWLDCFVMSLKIAGQLLVIGTWKCEWHHQSPNQTMRARVGKKVDEMWSFQCFLYSFDFRSNLYLPYPYLFLPPPQRTYPNSSHPAPTTYQTWRICLSYHLSVNQWRRPRNPASQTIHLPWSTGKVSSTPTTSIIFHQHRLAI